MRTYRAAGQPKMWQKVTWAQEGHGDVIYDQHPTSKLFNIGSLYKKPTPGLTLSYPGGGFGSPQVRKTDCMLSKRISYVTKLLDFS